VGDRDAFAEIARYYDPIMEGVDYDRWQIQVEALGAMLPRPFRHLDAGCGTANLVERLQGKGWTSAGIDLSPAMIGTAKKRNSRLPLAVADLRALPFRGAFDLVTCLFDSINFILDDGELRQAVAGLGASLAPGGILFFDVVTERMVRDHFEGPGWSEHNGRFKTYWKTVYDGETRIAETEVRVNHRAPAIIRERIYSQSFLEDAIADAGLTLLDVFDTDTLTAPSDRTIRIDFIAAREPSAALRKEYRTFRHCIALLQGKA